MLVLLEDGGLGGFSLRPLSNLPLPWSLEDPSADGLETSDKGLGVVRWIEVVSGFVLVWEVLRDSMLWLAESFPNNALRAWIGRVPSLLAECFRKCRGFLNREIVVLGSGCAFEAIISAFCDAASNTAFPSC